MTDEELKLYLVEVEKRYDEMSKKYQSAIQLIGRLYNQNMMEDALSYKDEIVVWLNKQNIEYNTHAGWSVSGLTETPDPELTSLWHKEMIIAAKNYYTKLDNNEDPGPAKEYLNALCIYSDPEIMAQKWEAFSKMIPQLDFVRLCKTSHKE